MSSITVELPEETRRRLEDKATRNGQPLEAYVRGVLEEDAALANVASIDDGRVTVDDSVEGFDKWLAELDDLPPIQMPAIPCEWTREDIYFDHDLASG
jgi:plasmid stability protein